MSPGDQRILQLKLLVSAEWDRSGAWAEVGAKIDRRPIPDVRLEIATGRPGPAQ